MLRTSRLVDLARKKRRTATVPEKLLWSQLKGGAWARFRRQEPIGPYIVDFVSHRAKLVVELDGRSHLEPGVADADSVRQAFLEALGYAVLRVPNDDVLRDPVGAGRWIWESVAARAPSPQPSPWKGEGAGGDADAS